MQTLEVGTWYKTGEILTQIQNSQQFIAIRCEIQRQPDGTFLLRGEATDESFPEE